MSVTSLWHSASEWSVMKAPYVLFAPALTIFARRIWEGGVDVSVAAENDDWMHQVHIDTVQLLAWGVAFYLLGRLGRYSRLSTTSLGILGVICLVGAFTSAIGLLALSIYFFFTDEGDKKTRAIAAIFAALFAQKVIAPVIFGFLWPELTRLDAALVGSVLQLTVPGAMWGDNIIAMPSGFSVEIIARCCSFHNVSLAALCWVALTKLERPAWKRLDVAVLAAAAGVQVTFNTVRIYLLVLSPEMYNYWHFGLGSKMFVASASAAAVLICTFGARWVSSQGNPNLRAKLLAR
jgi:hypothetical protein